MKKFGVCVSVVLAAQACSAFAPLSVPASRATRTPPRFANAIRPRQSKLYVNPGAELWNDYLTLLEANPLIVKSVTASVILGAADLAGQALERSQQQKAEAAAEEEANDRSTESAAALDWSRVVRFAIFGLVLQAPWNHFYYLMLDGAIPPTADPVSPTNIVKIGIDQFVQAPIFTVLIFVFLGLLEGKTTEAIQSQLRNDYKDTIIANWKLWVPATVINIGFVPPILRVLYLNVVFFLWAIYLSLVLNKKES